YVYRARLLGRVLREPSPKHVGTILYVNRLYGRDLQFIDPKYVYTLGAEKLDDVLTWCAELSIPAVTLWVLTTENLRRPPEEISGILAAIESKLSRLALDPRLHHQKVRVRAVGRLDLLPPSTTAALQATEDASRNYQAMT